MLQDYIWKCKCKCKYAVVTLKVTFCHISQMTQASSRSRAVSHSEGGIEGFQTLHKHNFRIIGNVMQAFVCPDKCNMFFLIFSKTNSLQEHPVSFALVHRLQNKRNCFKSESLKIINNCMIPSLYSLNLKSKYH